MIHQPTKSTIICVGDEVIAYTSGRCETHVSHQANVSSIHSYVAWIRYTHEAHLLYTHVSNNADV